RGDRAWLSPRRARRTRRVRIRARGWRGACPRGCRPRRRRDRTRAPCRYRGVRRSEAHRQLRRGGTVSAALTIPAGTGLCHLPAPFTLERGGALDAAHIAYECFGDESLPIVCALGGISAHRHVSASDADPRPGWWQDFVGPGRALDTRRWRVVGIDWLGGRGASSGPEVDEHPDAFPTITTRDQATALALLLDHLGVERAHAIVGSSYGGMVALAFAAAFHDRVDRIIALGAADRAHPYATAFRTVQRRVVRLGQETGRTTEAVALAR